MESLEWNSRTIWSSPFFSINTWIPFISNFLLLGVCVASCLHFSFLFFHVNALASSWMSSPSRKCEMGSIVTKSFPLFHFSWYVLSLSVSKGDTCFWIEIKIFTLIYKSLLNFFFFHFCHHTMFFLKNLKELLLPCTKLLSCLVR